MAQVNNSSIDFIHLDFLDGIMVPAKGLTLGEVKKLRSLTDLQLEAHVMEIYPQCAKFYHDLGIDKVYYHLESEGDLIHRLADAKNYGLKVGVAIKPSTDCSRLRGLPFEIIDSILLLANKRKGNKFEYDANMPDRINEVRKFYSGDIEVNSGVITYPDKPIEEGTTYKLSKAGATSFAIEKGILDIGLSIKKATDLNLLAIMS
jgi:ribulose-phosphate 3-epimerase